MTFIIVAHSAALVHVQSCLAVDDAIPWILARAPGGVILSTCQFITAAGSHEFERHMSSRWKMDLFPKQFNCPKMLEMS